MVMIYHLWWYSDIYIHWNVELLKVQIILLTNGRQMIGAIFNFTIGPNKSGIIKDYNGFGISCNGLSDGEIDVQVSGGNLNDNTNYTYFWEGVGVDNSLIDQTWNI